MTTSRTFTSGLDDSARGDRLLVGEEIAAAAHFDQVFRGADKRDEVERGMRGAAEPPLAANRPAEREQRDGAADPGRHPHQAPLHSLRRIPAELISRSHETHSSKLYSQQSAGPGDGAQPLHHDGSRMSISRAIAVAFTVTAALGIGLAAQTPLLALDAAELKRAIEQGLAAVPRGYERLSSPAQAGVRVRDVQVDRLPSSQRVTIDLSQKALTFDPGGDVELVLDQVIRSTAPLAGNTGDVHYQFLVDGLPLDLFVPRAEARFAARAAGKPRVVVSGGHGYYWNEHYSDWRLQRDHYWGIVEDVVNWEFAADVQAALRNTTFDARPARNPDPLSRRGPSGHT